ncbi:hypothetical protein CSC68_12500 [Pseudoxanthomonas suwonensis]|nr:hypothetical protein CSC68_12500 [Pseudoxanthomonas suwonensis]
MVVPAEATRLHAALRGLLPEAGWVAVGWRQDGVPGCAEAGDGGPAALGLLQRVLAGESVVAPGVEVEAWSDGDARLAVLAGGAGTIDADRLLAWRGAAQALLEAGLHAARLQARVQKLERSRSLQKALYEIADLAGGEVEMQEMLARLHGIIGTLMYAPSCYIVEYDEPRGTLRFLYFADDRDPYLAEGGREWSVEEMADTLTFALLRHGQALRGPSRRIRRALGLPEDVQAHGSESLDWLGVPMRRGERVCGAIVVQSYDRAGCYTEEDRALLGFVAQHVQTTLDRRQAQAELERRVLERTLELERANRELQEEVLERQRAERLQHALYRIAEMAVSSESLEQYYAKVHAAVDELLYARNFYIALLSEDRARIEFVYSVDEAGNHRPSRQPGRGLTEYVMRTGSTLLAHREDIDALIAAGEVQDPGQVRASSWLGVPLHLDGAVVGLIAVQSYDPQIRFSRDDERLLSFVAHNIGTGLARQAAQERLRVAHAELELRVGERTGELERANEQLLAQIGERLRAEQRLTHQALHDALTGLPNRSCLLESLAASLDRAGGGGGHPFAVLFLDLDRFKVVNDSIGHAAGDELLVEVSRRLVSAVRPGDVVARLGGDEFAVLVACSGHEEAREMARMLLALVGQPLWVAGRELFPSASMGIALWHPRYRRGEELLRDADAAMYRAKNEGRDRFAIFDEAMREQAMRSLDLEADMRRAIQRREFMPYYQPIVRLHDGAVIGHEALLRWRHERRGLLSPAAFIALGEESGLIEHVDWLLYEQVIGELARGGTGYISVNVSPRHFRSPDFASRLLGLLDGAGADPARLRLEITEVALMDDAPRTRRMLDALRARGVRALLDDFGTGFSALSYLHRFPILGLKIDRSFVAGLDAEGGREESLALVRAILALSRSLGMETVGEGIETMAQRDTLQELGCTAGQGYLLGRPVSCPVR